MESVELANWNEYSELFLAYGLKLVFALAILIIGWMVAKFLRRFARKTMDRAHMDPTLSSFLSNILYALALAFVIIATLNKVGIQTASLIAVLGAAGLAIGLALQGSLSNFAAGVMIILFKHFKVGDFIEGANHSGTVEALDIFNTTLVTPNNQTVIIPNAKLTEGPITNYSEKATRRLDLTIGISYEDNIDRAKNAIRDEITKNKRLLDSPEPMVAVKELGESSVNLAVRCWANTSDYWDAYFELLEAIKLRLDKEGVSIPYPQTELHIIRKSA